jgi:hypothetical protein
MPRRNDSMGNMLRSSNSGSSLLRQPTATLGDMKKVL